MPTVSVVIPALNEERNIPHVLKRIPEDVHQVVLVDGCSVDETVGVARKLRPDVCVVSQTRKGKGNALACGFEAATGEVIATVDADGSADPAEIPQFVAALVDGADFAKGSRFLPGGGSADITRLRAHGNQVLTTFFNLCYQRRYSDLCYGYNVFWRRHLPVLGLDAESPLKEDGTPLWGDGFEIETLIHVRVARAGLRVAEVPSFEYKRIHGVSNLNAARDGLRAVRTIFAERARNRRLHEQCAPRAEPPVAPPGAKAIEEAEEAEDILPCGRGHLRSGVRKQGQGQAHLTCPSGEPVDVYGSTQPNHLGDPFLKASQVLARLAAPQDPT
jgi:glycosyltransferase involved in cell wall biosynthesis